MEFSPINLNNTTPTDIDNAIDALEKIPCPDDYDTWKSLGMSLKSIGVPFHYYHSWCERGSKYKSEWDCQQKWDSYNENGGIKAGTFFKYARENGWTNSKKYIPSEKLKPSLPKEAIIVKEPDYAREIWDKCKPVDSHPYIERKKGKSDGLRICSENLFLKNTNISGYLAVPAWDGEYLQTIQFFPPGEGLKLNLESERGCKFNNGYFSIDGTKERIFILEGLAHAWTVNKATGCFSIVTFGSSRIRTISKILKEKYPNSKIILIPDRGEEDKKNEFASEIIKLPQEKENNYDINDYERDYGLEAVIELLKPKKSELSLDIEFADELSMDFEASDELIEGILTSGDGSIMYGDSNSGKTSIVIDMACSLARGVPWMGRETDKGGVLYLAAESPKSVRRRLQAYQKYHDVKVPNFAIVKNPINLFADDADANKIIEVIKILEKERNIKIKWVIGDTLSRIISGGNENAGADMGKVIERFDKIRNEGNTHFTLIHHCGKNAANGARGWSGFRAAVDTEIEITESDKIHCAEITKQRDLDTKGIRIGFELKQVHLGLTKFKKEATCCIVLSSNPPEKINHKKTGAIAAALIEYLLNNNSLIKKADIVKHFKGRFSRSGVYDEIDKLLKTGSLKEEEGFLKYSK